MAKEISIPWSKINNLAISTLLFLVAEYIAGMWLNVYTGEQLGGESTLKNSPVLTFHVLISILLLIQIFLMIVFSYKYKIKSWLAIAITSLICVLLAADQGYRFIKSENSLSSFLMALGFVIAFCLYGYGVLINKNKIPEAQEDE